MKKAFTMIELIMVIVIIGILAAVIVPRRQSTKTAEVAVQLVSDIRYTQHLAMIDDKFDSTNVNWFQDVWQIRFVGNTYSIVSNNGVTFAQDPLTKEDMNSTNIGTRYGVSITPSAGCATIGFDHMGRPLSSTTGTNYTTPYSHLMTNFCSIVLSDGTVTDDINISIVQETGYTSF